MIEPKHRTLFLLLNQISLILLIIFLNSCANESLNNTCDVSSKSYFETSLILTATGEIKHPCYPGVRIASNPGLNLSSNRGIISEFGGNALQGNTITFESFLGMAPKDSVSVQVIVSNPSYATVSPTSFVWTPSDWEVSKYITVTAVNDTIINGTRNFTIRLSTTSNDTSMRLQDQIISMDILDNDKIIFLTTGSYIGILGGVFGADGICQADVKCPVGKICKAMLADAGSDARQASFTAGLGDSQIDWVLKPFATYLRNDSPTVIGTTNAVSLFTFPIVGIRPTSATAWTGLSADWTSNANNCGSWTLNTGNGNAGDTAGTTTSAIGFSNFPCNSSLPFYCVEQ